MTVKVTKPHNLLSGCMPGVMQHSNPCQLLTMACCVCREVWRGVCVHAACMHNSCRQHACPPVTGQSAAVGWSQSTQQRDHLLGFTANCCQSLRQTLCYYNNTQSSNNALMLMLYDIYSFKMWSEQVDIIDGLLFFIKKCWHDLVPSGYSCWQYDNSASLSNLSILNLRTNSADSILAMECSIHSLRS